MQANADARLWLRLGCVLNLMDAQRLTSLETPRSLLPPCAWGVVARGGVKP